MVLSVVVGNGAQLCAMVGVTLSQSRGQVHYGSDSNTLYSIRTSWILVTFQSWLAGYRHDGLLDLLRRVSDVRGPTAVLG